ncbi:IclR family transcriptional regulator [Pseudooceanicola aestuarii]|uniref:IclR family transcriptional regulator n=1 Tax=Pseudooceanicola aestuarii TaxID=2697319 RepID=UPI0013D85838|nr:IclR family transcriptional regulator [Pseudooceanicola aestuarii]
MAETEKTVGRNGIQVIARAAAILRVLREDSAGMSLGQIAERVGLPRSTVQRIIGALQEERLVISSGGGGSIRLGPEITALSEAAHYSVVEECRMILSDLSQSLGETADLSVLRGRGMIFLDQVAGTHRLRAVSSVGDVFPLTSTANGRAALALLDRPLAQKLTMAEWRDRDREGDWPAFSAMLDQVAQDGVAFDEDQHTPGISAVGAAFRDLRGEIHAISVPIPSHRFKTKRTRCVEALTEALTRIDQQPAP